MQLTWGFHIKLKNKNGHTRIYIRPLEREDEA